MWELKSKDLYQKIFFYKKIFFYLINLFIILNFFVSFVIFDDKNIYFWNLVITLFMFLFQLLVNMIISLFVNKVLRKKMIYELIDNNIKTNINKNYQILYLFIVQNGFNESRVIQSMRQNHSFIDYWIIDNTHSSLIEKISIQNRINYVSLDYDNNNFEQIIKLFLSKYNLSFDFLMVSDTNTIVNKDFINSSIKMMCGKEKQRIGFVSSQMKNIKEKNFYNNIFLNYENIKLFSEVQLNNLKIIDFKDLRNNSVYLIQKKWIDECLLSGFSYNKEYWQNIINPLIISSKSFYDNYLNLLQKEQKYQKKKSIIAISSHFFLIWNSFIWTLFISIVLTILTISWNEIINSHWFFIFIIIFLVITLLCFAIYLINNIPIIGWKIIGLLFFNITHYISRLWTFIFKFKNIKKCILLLFLLTILLVSVNIGFFININNWNLYKSNFGWTFLITFLNVFLGSMWLSVFSFLFLYCLSLIKIKRKNY